MSVQLVVAPDPEAAEEERLRARIDALRDEIATATSELEELRAVLTAFEARFDARIGVLIVEMDRLSVQIAEYQRRLEALSEPTETWTQVEEEIRQRFEDEWERIETEAEESQRSSQRAADLPTDPPEDVKAELRRLFRKLAREYHPDLATNEDERVFNEHAMRRINSAFETNDLDALKRLDTELPAKDGTLIGSTAPARIAWAVAQIGRLEQSLIVLRADIAKLQSTDKFRMYEMVASDSTLLDNLEFRYRTDIESKRTQLESLITAYRSASSELFTNRRDIHEQQ